MKTLIQFLAVLVAIQHFGFLYLEMFLWTKPMGLKTFRMTSAQAEASKVLAMNQGLYNGFLATGLLWSVVHPVVFIGSQLKLFFFGCVVIAGIFGALTVSKRILWIQASPSLVGFVLTVWMMRG